MGISALCEIGSHKRFLNRRVTSSDSFFFFNLLWLWLKTEGEGGIRDNKKVNSGGKKMVLDLGVIADIVRSSQSLDFEWSRVNRIC